MGLAACANRLDVTDDEWGHLRVLALSIKRANVYVCACTREREERERERGWMEGGLDYREMARKIR